MENKELQRLKDLIKEKDATIRTLQDYMRNLQDHIISLRNALGENPLQVTYKKKDL